MQKNQNHFHGVNGKRQILVVDDEMINREILGEYLKDDYTVLFASDGVQAIEIIQEQKDSLSLILLDLLMPGISGKEVLKRVKDDIELAHIPVIVMTADQESEVECLQLGASDFIPKPYPNVSVVLARVLKTIELSEDRYIIQSTERDTLTGLYTREYFYRYAEQFDRRNKDLDMDAILIDISHFRLINERYGRDYGDEVLRRVGEILKNTVHNDGGMVSRKEADTFLIYAPSRDDYQDVLQKVVEDIGADESMARGRVRLRMGIYARVDKSIDIERRFDRAKMAADTVRASVTKTIGIYDDEMRQKEIYSEQLVDDFETALAEKQFVIYFQPKFDVRPDTPYLSSAEALVRWKHPKLGMISPGVFIPLFEDNGMIQKLDHYIWRETARQIRDWKDRLGYMVPVSVNVSRVDLYDPNLVQTLLSILDEFGLSADELNLEITESAYTQDSQQIIETVKHLRELNFHIEMDDFGTGYSSLNMISTLPIDALKLDMQFIRNAFKQDGNTRMLEIIIELADYLSVPVIAEGVETEEQMKTLKDMGCDIVQGYYFSKPIPAEEFEPFIIEGQTAKEAYLAAQKAEREAMEAKHMAEIAEIQLRHPQNESESLLESHPELLRERRQLEDNGIHMRTMNIIFLIIALLAAGLLYAADMMVTRGFQQAEQAANRFIMAQQAAYDMASGSDYLTFRVRSFVYNGDIRYVNEFFDELNVTKRREKALADLEELMEGSDNAAYESLATALDLSNELVDREYLAMRLTLEAGDYPEDAIPDVLKAIELTPEYASMTPEELRKTAQGLVFDDVYMDYKARINENVSKCTDTLLLNIGKEFDDASNRMDRLLRAQSILTGLMVIVVLGQVFFIRGQVRIPLTRMVEQMRSQKPVSPEGAEELRFVTRTYNEILLENKKVHADLSFEASHDALTGLFNRGAYEMLLQNVDLEHVALLLIDIDYFKTVNDTYGHDVGDKVLRKVADILKRNFRSVDVICRIGGDEFVVIMTRANSSMRQLVNNKIEKANQELKNPKDGLPSVSLSVGVAFSDRRNPQGDIFKDADTALYVAKKEGRGCCRIY